ncbi:hypothetical protein FHS15_001560 [Paenibacillus castaneae]|uniref:hypothetical protein n=1 Tax=Paenibacillus castaneae TaxID=474957 RepID=UPI000C9A0B71|nr:hypothetical protein [Paenibacillus castaneae]NIK76435.1 hypothetical protein [Paenibacillus castaneae]
MSETHGSREEHHNQYEIRLKGHLDDRWIYWFEGLRITHESDRTTILTVQVVDQPALHGVLRKVRGLGLPLVSVLLLDPNQANGPNGNENKDPNHSKKKETNI